ncbi:tetratricopeptide repeat protein [Deinococcus peraridilitoris]|nr:tetratricopeptide repeat protein [Deinococcus peraridilitoris]
MYDDAIVQLEAMLAKLKPDALQRAQLVAQLEALKKARDQFAAQPAPQPAAPRPAPAPPKSTGPLTLAQALTNTRALVETGKGRQSFAALTASPAGKDPRRASALAAAAVLRDRPVGALAALLAARAAEPKNPSHLVNAAGLLSLLGRPVEAIALLDGADALKVPFPSAMGLNGQAVALNNRGHALLGLGRAKDAEAVLRRAVSLEPLLAEARTNLAMALRAQNKTEEAVRFFRAGMRRSPPPSQPAVKPPPTSGQTPPPGQSGQQSADPFSPEGAAQLPAERVYDLSRGVRGDLPRIKWPKTPAEAEAQQPKLEAMIAEIKGRNATWHQRLQVLQARLKPVPGPGSDLSHMRVSGIINRIDEAQHEPSLRQLWSTVEDARSRNNVEVMFNGSRLVPGTTGAVLDQKFNPATASGRFWAEVTRLGPEKAKEDKKCPDREPGSSACREAVQVKYDKLNCEAARKGLDEWRASAVRLDNALAAYFAPAYKLMTGLAANISDPVQHQIAVLYIEREVDNLVWIYLLTPATSLGPLPAYSQFCKEPGVAEDPKPAVLTPAQRCILGGATFEADLFVASVSYDCEKVAVEVEKGFLILDGFVEVEYVIEGTKTGEVTVGVGVKGEVGGGPLGTGVEAKGGCYLTVDTGTGKFVDAGVRGGVSAGVAGGALQVEASGSIVVIAG